LASARIGVHRLGMHRWRRDEEGGKRKEGTSGGQAEGGKV
jgi:hypothetical protein